MANRANFQRLDDDSWGVKVQGQNVTQLEGQTVQVIKRNGEIKEIKLGRRIDSWNGGRSAVYVIFGKDYRGPEQLRMETRQPHHDDAEYQRGVADTKAAQMMGPAGSEAREAAYLEMELQWAREGFDG